MNSLLGTTEKIYRWMLPIKPTTVTNSALVSSFKPTQNVLQKTNTIELKMAIKHTKELTRSKYGTWDNNEYALSKCHGHSCNFHYKMHCKM